VVKVIEYLPIKCKVLSNSPYCQKGKTNKNNLKIIIDVILRVIIDFIYNSKIAL
jgi:hypothetical protein